VSAYGRSKREAEELLGRLEPPPDVVVLRPTGVYGPRDRDIVPLFRAAFRGFLPTPVTRARIQPVYVTDVATAVLRAAAPGAATGFGPFPIAEPRRYAWDEIRAALEAATGRRIRHVALPPVLYEIAGAAGEAVGRATGREPIFDRRRARDLARHAWTCDVAATEEALGWRAEVALPEGVRRTLDWYRAEGWMSGRRSPRRGSW
jgi:nucleoside-diphosphate-sugar epimerase